MLNDSKKAGLSILIASLSLATFFLPVRSLPEQAKQAPYYKTIVLTAAANTKPLQLESALLELRPVDLTIYKENKGLRTIAATVETGILKQSLEKAKASKVFKSANMASAVAPGGHPDKGSYFRVGVAYDELTLNSNSELPRLSATIDKFQGKVLAKTSRKIIRFESGHALAALLALLAECPESEPRAYIASQNEHVLILKFPKNTSPETIEKAVLALHPLSIHIKEPGRETQDIAVDTVGPDATERAFAIAKQNRSILYVQIPEKREKREFLWDINLKVDKLTPPENEIILYKQDEVSEQSFNESLKRLAVQAKKEEMGMYLLTVKPEHFISTYIKVMRDKHFSGVSQNMKLGG